MFNSSSSRTHDLAAVERAIRALSAADVARLRKVAAYRLRAFGLDAVGRDHEDLLAEAITRTLSGKRKWRRGVDFVHHLAAIMRSIAEQWQRRSRREAASGAAQKRVTDLAAGTRRGGDETADPLSERPSPEPGPEAALAARQEIERFERRFADDENARAVIECWRMGIRGSEIVKRTGIPKKDVEAAALRIRRFARGSRS